MNQQDPFTYFSYPDDHKMLAFIDIVGFSHFIKNEDWMIANRLIHGLLNSVHQLREAMARPHERDVPAGKIPTPQLQKIWADKVPEGTVNFLMMSDSVVLYSNSGRHLLQVLAFVMAYGMIYNTPLRAGVSLGNFIHTEGNERPGTAFTVYGNALTKAVQIEKHGAGSVHTVFVDRAVVDLAKTYYPEENFFTRKLDTDVYEYKWWHAIHPFNVGMMPFEQRITEARDLSYGKHFHWFSDEKKKQYREKLNQILSEIEPTPK